MPERRAIPASAQRAAMATEARSARAAIVSDGFTVSEVGTALPSVTKRPGEPRSSWSDVSADVDGSSPIRQDDSGWAVSVGCPLTHEGVCNDGGARPFLVSTEGVLCARVGFSSVGGHR